MEIELSPIEKLTKDLKESSRTLLDHEARFLVDAYYTMQDNRIRTDSQIREMNKAEEPNLVLQWLSNQNTALENQIKMALDKYSLNHPAGEWAQSICGIGPVISAGLIAHIDIHKCPTACNIYSFGGYNPMGKKWEKGQKRPFNATLKTLFWKIGESFVKVSNNDKDFYGKYYQIRKEQELAYNAMGKFKDQAEFKLANNKIGKDTDAYKSYSIGQLPLAHLHARAKRYAVKLFISHFHAVWFEHEFKKKAPRPYALTLQGHEHMIDIPNNPFK